MVTLTMVTLTMATLTMATLTMATLTILYVLYCTYGLRVPASVLYVLYVRATRTNLRTCINEKRFFLHVIGTSRSKSSAGGSPVASMII